MGMLGPHEGIELELMLKREKNIALFYSGSEMPLEFNDLIKNKFFNKITVVLKSKDIEYNIIYNPLYYHEAKRLQSIIKSDYYNLEIEREIGEILGYSTEDIDFYIEKIKNKL